MERTGLPEQLVRRAYSDMAAIHRWLGDIRFLMRAICADALPVRRILDIGCGSGMVAAEIGRRLSVETVGVDLRPQRAAQPNVRIFRADAVRDGLPHADVAFAMNLGHHLNEADLAQLIVNVGRSCRRFILIDLVRHRLPLTLFRCFVRPFVGEIAREDGQRSIRRAYTPRELRALTASALAGTGASFRLSVAPLYTRQAVDIRYAGGNRSRRGTASSPHQTSLAIY